MKYVSTRGGGAPAEFGEALLSGLAPDGGLYMPAAWPHLDRQTIRSAVALPFADGAATLLEVFTEPFLAREELLALSRAAFATFDHRQVAPLRRIGGEEWLLELFHGPTLAFKDVAMQLLSRLFDRALGERGAAATIVAATSGDTGGAAVAAFAGASRADLFILHPKGRISEVQRRMMTTAAAPNVCNIAVAGTFDDCQRIVKELLADAQLREAFGLGAVNSINWARLAIQAVYYFTALALLEREFGFTEASFAVPTGNFGDAFSGYAARRMGARIKTICVAVNQNDILHRAFSRGRYRRGAVAATTSPSMDIQVASNFERLLFEALGRDGEATGSLMRAFEGEGDVVIPDDVMATLTAGMVSVAVSEDENRKTIGEVYRETGTLIDPHTAVGVAAARRARTEGRLSGPVIALATAHPAKFPDAVAAAAGVRPELPQRLAGLFDLKERCLEAPPSVEAVRKILVSTARAAK